MATKKEKDPNFATPIIIPGLDEPSSIIDVEGLGDKVMETMKRTPSESVLNQMRDWFKQGYIVYASDVKAPVLEYVHSDEGDHLFVTGLSFDRRKSMRNKKRKEFAQNLSDSL